MTAYTVTGTTTNNVYTGGLFQVVVLDNAAVAGSPAVGSSTTAYNCSVSTTADGSYVFGIASNLNAETAYTAEGNCTTLTDYANGSVDTETATFRTTNTTTGTPGATTVGFSTTFSGQYGAVAMEILASGGTLTTDGSSPAAVESATGTSFTTASFSPPGSSVLVAMLAVTGNELVEVCVATVSSSPSLTWTEQVKVSSEVSPNNAYLGVWTATVPAAITITPPSWAQRVAVVPFSADVIM